jgi:rare lipoprotein A
LQEDHATTVRQTATTNARFPAAGRLFTALFLAVLAVSCTPKTIPPPQPTGYGPLEGIASWYGDDFHGRKTSSGERYNMYKLTAAHKTMPLGSRVRVTRLDNGREVEVKINDRGPFVEGRIIDLSYGAAIRLDMVRDGVAQVKITVLSFPEGTPAAPSPSAGPVPSERPVSPEPSSYVPGGEYWIQVGSFVNPRNAEWLREQLMGAFPEAEVSRSEVGGTVRYRVRIGPHSSRDEAGMGLEVLADYGFTGVVTEN